MKTTKTYLLIFLTLLLIGTSQKVFAQKNEVKGVISISPQKKKKRVSRGKAYRNRTKGKADTSKNENDNQLSKKVVISLRPLSFEATVEPREAAIISQENKSFSPKLLAVTKGTMVYFVNKDDFYHNVFSITPKSKFNIGRRPAGSKQGKKIKKVGLIKVFCDIHSHMKANIISLDTPYFTTIKEDGRYHLKNLPDGEYEVVIYHSDLKKTTSKIEVKGGTTLNKNFILNGSSTASVEESIRYHPINSFCKTDASESNTK